ncbi:uncharacterized protein V6R79_021802 [Siganus canaliculatus]
MEDYDKFVQHRLSHLRKSEEHEVKPSLTSSLIRFHGQPILPPLLSREQREEMQQHRDAAQKVATDRKPRDDARMTYVQTILQSVQLRKTPTLEELLLESPNAHSIPGGSLSQSSCLTELKDDFMFSSSPEQEEKDGACLPPLTSTTYSAFFPSNATLKERYHEQCLTDQHHSPQGSQLGFLNNATHQSVSSGYVTCENVENATRVSGGVDAEGESHDFSSSDGACDTVGFFLHNTSDTIAKMPDIISHPPIDGEELERSGLESSLCNDFIVVTDIHCSSLQEDSVVCDHLPEKKCETSHVEGEDFLPVTTLIDVDKNHTLDSAEVPVFLSEGSGLLDNPESSQTTSGRPHLTPELYVKHDPAEVELADSHADETEPSEEPYRLSLQALLKKSQEYRRRQRMLRNQAKNTKIQEGSQEQARAMVEAQNLSDKENDEFASKGGVTAEGRKTKERKGAFILSLERSPKKSRENDKTIESEWLERNLKIENTLLTGDENTSTTVERETTFKNNKLNISQEAITESQHISPLPHQLPITLETSPLQEAFYLTSNPTALCERVEKFHSIPAPSFCRSPVHFRSRSSIREKEAAAAAGVQTSKRKVLVCTGLNEDINVELNMPPAAPSTANLMDEGDLTGVSAMSSQHIDQLESNLSGLKVLISDLESALIEKMGNHSSQSELSFGGIKETELTRDVPDTNARQSERDCGDDDLKDDSCSTEGVRRQSSGVNAERAKEIQTCKEGFLKNFRQHGGYRKQQPPAKCVLSETQRLLIPQVFRNIPSERTAPQDVSGLSNTSSHPEESRNGIMTEDPDSSHLPSLNQSYDVEAPSGLWFLAGPESDLSSRGVPLPDKQLTPDSGSQGQAGISKVKRKLLMHVTEQEGSPHGNTRTGSVVRPSSSTPRAAARWQESPDSQKHKIDELKEIHAAQVRALQDEHQRQQRELLQALAERYRALQSVSFPFPVSGSRLGDTLTFPALSQPASSPPEHYRTLLAALVKGFLTRRLLRTERVTQLVRTIRDSQHFLQALQQQSPGRGEFCSRQDVALQERVTLQLRAARYEVNDIFFSLSGGERMQLISWDRELAREREMRQQSGQTNQPRRKSSLSAATQKSLQRKRGVVIQKKKTAERPRGAVTRTGHNSGSSAEQPLETKRGQFRANPQRVPKTTYSSRPQ